MKKKIKLIFINIIILILTTKGVIAAEKEISLLKQDWSFKSFFGTFDRASLQRGYQVYTEVCASCH